MRLVISSVSVPLKPGSTKPAVAWTISPSRPRLDLPSIRATTSSGISTYSCVRPSANSPGWITNGSSPSITTSSVRLRRRVAQVDRRGAVVVEHAERVAQPQVDRRGLDHRGVPRLDDDAALLDEAADRAVGEDGGGRGHARTLSLQAGGRRAVTVPDARRRRRRRIAVRTAARRARERARADAGAACAPPSPPGCSSSSGTCWIAHQTSQQSASSGTLSATKRKNIVHSIAADGYAYARVRASPGVPLGTPRGASWGIPRMWAGGRAAEHGCHELERIRRPPRSPRRPPIPPHAWCIDTTPGRRPPRSRPPPLLTSGRGGRR